MIINNHSPIQLPLNDWNIKNINSLLETIPKSVQYQIYNRFSCSSENFDHIFTQKPNFIFINFDLIQPGEYDHTNKDPIPFVKNFLKLVNNNPDTKFVLFYSHENLEKILTHDRLHLVRFGSGLSREADDYQVLLPELDKDFSSHKIFMCLNRQPRQHRINLVSYLLGLNFEQYGTVSFDKKNATASAWLERCSWTLTQQQIEQVKPALLHGYEKLKTLDLYQSLDQVNQIYNQFSSQPSNRFNAENFDVSLRSLYRNHFVEIVSETLFNFPFLGVSEKFKNSVYGCVFPILVGGAGLVKFLQDLGFDMFDDIVDHSYDSIQDPLDRLCASINLNRLLLCDSNRTKKLWMQNKHRFISNIDFIKNKMLDILKNRAQRDFEKISWNVRP